MALLEIEGLEVSIPVPAGVLHAVRGIDLAVDRGQTLCIVGESGCGKSLTSLALMGLLPRHARVGARRMAFDGAELLAMGARERAVLRGDRMAMIFQEPMTSLNPTMTIGAQLVEGYRLHRGATRAAARDRAVHLLERVGISAAASRLGQYLHQLSGGLRQRVMIAMALMCEPTLLIADEPTTALDVTIQAQILHLLKDIQAETGLGMIFITHDLGVVARIADRVAVMYAGEVVEAGSAARVFGDPVHPYTRGLLECIPWPGHTARQHALGAIPGVVPNLVGHMPGCAFADRCAQADLGCRVGRIGERREADHAWRCLAVPEVAPFTRSGSPT